MKTFGEEVRRLRKLKGITQKSLAEKVGVDFTYVSKMENDRLVHSPSEEVIRKIAKLLDVDASNLLILARKVPSDLRDTIVTDELVLDFLRVAPMMNESQRAQLKSMVNDLEEQ